MQKRTVLDKIVLGANGATHLRFLKQVVDDDGTIFASVPHRVVVESWDDPKKIMDFANERLSQKHAPVTQADQDWFEASMKAKRDKK